MTGKVQRVRGLAAVLTVSVLLAGCGAQNAAEQAVRERYALEDVQGAGDTQQKVYRAENRTVPDVAQEIAANDRPDEISRSSEERMFLVYPNQMIHVQQDPEKKTDALVEVNTKEFVRQHYDPSFLQGFIAATFLSTMFGSNWRAYPHGSYTGYGDYRRYRDPRTSPTYRTPTTPTRSPSYTPPASRRGTGRVIRRR